MEGFGLTQIGFQQFAARTVSQTANGLFFDLSYAFTGQSEFFSDFFEGHFGAADTEEIFDDVAFTVGQGRERAFDFGS